MPMKNAIRRPIEKFRSSRSFGSRKGRDAVRLCATKIQKAIAATPASRQISGESNQSRRWPRSIISCSPVIATDSARKPVQSNWSRDRVLYSASANQMQVIATRPGGTIMKNAARQL